MADWYVNHGGKTYGPFSPAQLKQLAASAKINADSQVRVGTDGAWTRAENVKGLFEAKKTASLPTPTAVATAPKVEAKPKPVIGDSFDVDEVSDNDDDDGYYGSEPRRTYATETLVAAGAIIAIFFLLLNAFGGLVAGIWLAFKGEWRLIFGGILAAVVMPWGFSIAALPALGLGILLILTGDPPPRWAMATIGFLAALWNAILIGAWTVLIFITFMRHAESGLTIPLLLWAYSTTMSPLAYMAKYEGEASAANVAITFAMLTYVALVILFFADAQRITMYVTAGTLAAIGAIICTLAGVAMVPAKRPAMESVRAT